MKIVLEDAKFFKSCVDAIVNLIDEGEFDVDEGGIGLRATDPSGIAMVEFKLPRSAFKEFSIESPLKLGVDFSELARITSRVRAKESVTITIDEGKTRIGLKFKEKTTRSFNIPLIDISSTGMPSLSSISEASSARSINLPESSFPAISFPCRRISMTLSS